MKIAILQPGYLPWLGFFEQMARTDHFVYYNDVQYTRKDWRNRNRVKTSSGPVWLTVPVRKAPRETPISRIEVNYHEPWPDKHLRTIEHAYHKAPYFHPFFSRLQGVLTQRFDLLQDLNHAVVQLCREFLDLDGPVSWSSELNTTTTDKNERILEVCAAHSADLLYDGKAAADFIDADLFTQNGVRVVFQDYQHPVYPQLWGPFVSHLSAIDLIMNTGPDAPRVLRRSPAPCKLNVAESVTSTEPVDGERSYV